VTATTYEMAIKVISTGSAVLHVVATGDSAFRARVTANRSDFERFSMRYALIARSEASRALGRRILEAHRGFHALGDTLMNLSDLRRDRARGFGRAGERLEALLAEEIRARIDGRGRDADRKLAALSRLEADVSGIGSSVGRLLQGRDPEQRARMGALAEDFDQTLASFLELRLEDDERARARPLRRAFGTYLAAARELTALAEAERRSLDRFTRLESQVEQLVSEGIHSLARTDLLLAQRSARRAIHTSLIAVLVLLVAGILIGSSTALPTGRSIVRSDAALRERMAELALAHRRKDEFLGVLGHELRNPLAPLGNALQVLESRAADVPEDVRRTHRMMHRQVRNIARLVDDLLDVSRINEGKITLRRAPVELGAVVNEVVQDLGHLFDARGRRLDVALPDAPVWVSADRTRIEQVIANLLHNAAKYTHEGGRVRIALARADGEAVLAVEDDGIGIPPEMLARVFEPFTQVDQSLTREHSGLGIGLTLVDRLVGLHGGRVEARSEGPGRGSTFVVRLPRLEAAPESARGVPSSPAPAAPARTRRVLIVDDNRDSAESLAALLDLWGHETHAVHDGPAAVAAARDLKPELVLLDIGLPGMDGYAVARALRADPGGRDLVLVALTGLGLEEDRRRALEAGFDAHATKPVDVDILRDLMQRTRTSG
jgi:signal transduction histidine kinase